MKKYFLVLGLLFVVSCKKADASEVDGLNLYFETPQPINDSELSKIPNKLRGVFMNSDSIFINIKEDVILRESYSKFRFHKKQMDSLKQEFDFSDGKGILKINRQVFDCKKNGDSLELSSKDVDTIFVFSNTQKAKRINGQLVLNTKDSIFWKIKIIQLDKNLLKIKYISSEEDLKRIDSITRVKSKMIDSSSFVLKPSRGEFKKIINLKHLGEGREFKKTVK
ncbi:hypothetical protein [Flavobacterium sp. AED]|uniref:hypothetical protein n=1 Tax=Flavobacterium sp. AED TaxID=1423323 RepID=UPI00057E6D97|nr:hypothetical protein [Flavobacterium sp. AED]KIA86342.1 hypothetical protein OA85_01320 [Flavobacterium sp. AED]